MIKVLRLSALGVVLAFAMASASCAQPGERFDQGAPVAEAQLTVDGETRRYLRHLPQGAGLKPLVILLHGGGGTPEKAWNQQDYPDLARRDGAILLAPAARDGNWNDGRTVYYRGGGETASIDDLGFLTGLIDHAIQDYGADPSRVYVTGASNGGKMAFRLACERADRITAIAPNIATMQHSVAASCRPAQPVAVQLLAGTEDPLVNYNGGTSSMVAARRGLTLDARLSAPESAAFWAERNGCGEARQTPLPDRARSDRSTVVRFEYADCAPGGETVFFSVVGGGHTLPSLQAPERGANLAGRLAGGTNRDLDTDDAVWTFLMRQSR